MPDTNKPRVGAVVWRDLTVADAERVRAFYCDVVGWESQAHNMGEYDDFDIKLPDSEETVAGICHARGDNANVPPQWLMYITVADVAASAKKCAALGGTIVDGPRAMGRHTFCVIRDPAGAVAALIDG
jgi:hypothetical protein